ncbi:MAG: hypothetical protein HC925_01165 [Coleofasciculaceae cyanobacterium SM2_3_26]|nr:hypothetical protein [Coleofasciculaceae cyanobacterium SM2_3_26]
MLQALANTFDSSSRDHSSFQGTPAYKPAHLSHVTAIAPDGTASLFLVVYLPESYGPASDAVSACVQAKIGRGQWQIMERSALEGNGTTDTQAEKDFWTLQVEGVPPGTAVTFRYIDHQGTWRPLQPLNDLETVRGTSYVPNLAYQWKYKSPEFDHAKVLMETTLEGLLAGYKGGLFAPRSLEEMFQLSTAKRILKTDIPGRIAEWSVDEIMVPVSSSVADRSQLDPKFNYLTYNGVGLDWQIGTARDFMQLLDTFHQYNIRVVPDLIFAHQVKEPFKGSIDQVRRANGEKLVVDIHAFLFRDYGTWMFKLSDPNVRRLLIENIVAFIAKFRLSMFRIDYIDGLILQYSNRDRNHAETFVAELKEELRRAVPETVALGETFEVASNPFVSDFIDVFYAPVGFTIVEELYKPPSKMARPLYPDVAHLAMELSREARSQRRDAVYAQLHDETWYCQHIVTGRPYVPWHTAVILPS